MKYKMPDGETVEKTMPQWKTPWNHDTNFESDRTALYCNDPSLTKQEFKEDADINNIINRFLKTGEPPTIVLPEHFADLTGRTTYYDMATKAADANELFYLLPPAKRAEFLNDPTRWADAVVQAVNRADVETLQSLGIDAKRPKEPQEAKSETPVPGGTPAPKTPPAPPGDSKEGGTPPKPPSDKGE